MNLGLKYACFGALALLGAVRAQNAEKPVSAPTQAEEVPDVKDTTKSNAALQELRSRFLNLPEEQRTAFAYRLTEANRLLKEKRVLESMGQLDEAEKICAGHPDVENLRGGGYVYLRDFGKAKKHFLAALKYNPQDANLRFNLAECFYANKEWALARKLFGELYQGLPDKKTEVGYLLEFKIELCALKLGENEEFAAYAKKYKPTDDTLAYAYANGTLLLAKRKNDAEAVQMMMRANQIYGNATYCAAWKDALVETGFLTDLGIMQEADRSNFQNQPASSPAAAQP